MKSISFEIDSTETDAMKLDQWNDYINHRSKAMTKNKIVYFLILVEYSDFWWFCAKNEKYIILIRP